MKFYLKFIITLLNSLFISPNYIWRFVSGLNCNVDLCGSVVTKCQLMQSCPCSLDDIVCHQKCLNCLSRLFPSCCSCVELCGTDYENVSIRKSLIGLFNGVPELFNTFVYDNDDELDNDNDNNDNNNDNDDATLWTIIKFPAYKNLKKILPNTLEQFDQIYNQVNCTVLYFTTCITHKVCAQNCESMGASSYRWFEDGCCECAGSYCLNYGLNENHCSACPPNHHLDDYIDDEHSKQDDGATAFAAAADNNDNDDEDDDDDDDDDDDNINIDDLDTLEFGEDGVNDISKNKDTDDNDNDNDNDNDSS